MTLNTLTRRSARRRIAKPTRDAARSRQEKKALELLAREFAPAATSMAPGTMALVPGRPTPSPLVSVFSCLLPKADVPVKIVVGSSEPQPVAIATSGGFVASASESLPPAYRAGKAAAGGATERVLLERLVFARSGDKGDTANVGVIARRSECAAAHAMLLRIATHGNAY